MLAPLGDDQAIRPAHFLMQHPDGIGGVVIRTERVRADELCQLVGLVGFGATDAAHFVQDDGHAHICSLPGCFGACHAAANDVAELRALVQDLDPKYADHIRELLRIIDKTRDDLPDDAADILIALGEQAFGAEEAERYEFEGKLGHAALRGLEVGDEFLDLLIALPDYNIFVAESQGMIVGFLELELVEDTAIIESFGVKAEQRRKGFGSALLKQALDYAWKQSGIRCNS